MMKYIIIAALFLTQVDVFSQGSKGYILEMSDGTLRGVPIGSITNAMLATQPQATLVSGTNIKTVNGNTLLGSGDVTISGTAAWGSVTGTLSSQTDLQNALNAKQNTITTGTTAQYFRGDLSLATFPTTTAAFSNSTNKNFVTDAQATVIGNTSGTNTGDNSANTTYSNDYRAANFVAGTNYLAPNGNGSALTSLTAGQVGLGNVTNESKSTMFTNAVFTGTFDVANGSIANADLANSAVANLSGTNTGDNATNSQYSGLVSNANHTGDATGSTALTLATVNSNVGSFTNANITVNAKGLVTAASNGSAGGGPTFINLASNFSSTSVTEAAVTGWSFAVTSGKTYRIEVIAAYQTAATTTGGELGFFLSASAVGTIRGFAEADIVSTAAATGLKIPINTSTTADAAGSFLISSGVTAINSPHSFYALVTFTCTTSGTFNVGWATEVAASASQLNANSSLIYQLLN